MSAAHSTRPATADGSKDNRNLAIIVGEIFRGQLLNLEIAFDEVTIEVPPSELLDVCGQLRDRLELGFEQLMDLSGVDYLHYGLDEWKGSGKASSSGFGRGVEVERKTTGRLRFGVESVRENISRPRFAVVYHLLSCSHNRRLRLRCPVEDSAVPLVPSVTPVWSCADWYEREAFDLFGIYFDNHPDLRRLLTDYGFIGHPFRKDFPMIGTVEVRYDPAHGRVVNEPVSIEPRVLVPRVIGDEQGSVQPRPEAESPADSQKAAGD